MSARPDNSHGGRHSPAVVLSCRAGATPCDPGNPSRARRGLPRASLPPELPGASPLPAFFVPVAEALRCPVAYPSLPSGRLGRLGSGGVEP